jgi:peptidoglycan biosynthesis protein MviN/MurJ (putative lipid II flippase)
LKFYLLGAYFACGALITNRLYYAVGNTLLPMIVSTGAVVLTAPLYWILARTVGVRGIALSASLAFALQFIVVYWLWSVQKRNGGAIGVVRKLILISAVAAVGALGAWQLQVWLIPLTEAISPAILRDFVLCAVAGGIPLVAVMATIDLTRIEDIRGLLLTLLGRRRRSANSTEAASGEARAAGATPQSPAPPDPPAS